jgi:flagellin
MLQTSIERLSSGLRINSAKDDAAGQGIANRFTANINGLTQAARNANDGISLAQTTEGALQEITNNLQRIRQLAVQAPNSTNSEDDLASIQAEIDQRLQEINRISAQTQFNGVRVLATTGALKFQVGANDNETIDVNLRAMNTTTLFTGSFKYSTFTLQSDNTYDIQSVPTTVNTPVLPNVITNTVGTGSAVFAGNSMLIASIDNALAKVDKLRGELGAVQNRFESTINSLNITTNNMSAARSRIQDADYALEVSNLTKAQILQQAGTSVLAQANQIPQGVLSLLR